MAFNRGERPDQVPRVRIEDTPLEAYRYANWDPYVLLDDISHNTLEAGAEGKHLWGYDERTQMDAVATWLASSRQIVGHTLIAGAERDGKIPRDVATMAEASYKSALDWVEYRGTVRRTPDLTLKDVNFPFALKWPQPGVNPISPELFAGLKTASEHLLHMAMPAVIRAMDAPFRHPEFRHHYARMGTGIEAANAHLVHIGQLWNSRLNPNVAPGSDTYQDLTAGLEDIIRLGVNGLMPATADPRLRLAKKEKKEDIGVPEFDPEALRRRPTIEVAPTLPSFDASTLKRPPEIAEEPSTPPEPVQPILPAFDSSILFSSATPETEPRATEPEPTLPAFDARKLQPATPALPEFDPNAIKSRPGEPETPGIPAFDPGAILGKPAPAEPTLPAFDPDKLRNPQKDDEPTLPAFDPEQLKNRQRELPE